MKVSIAMATYNGEKYILEQLESFSNQTRLPNELVITDDCSSDNSIEIINEFKKTASFEVKIYINQVNLGYAQNFNRALELCTGDLIFLSDQDDVWFPTKIEYMINLAIEYPDKALYMIDARLTDENLKESEFTKQGQIRDLGLTERSFVMGCCIAIKKDLLQPILPVPSTLAHDNWLVNIADMLNLRHIDDSVQQYYRIHTNNTSPFIANNLFKMQRIERSKITFQEKSTARLKSSKISVLDDIIKKKSIFVAPLERLSKQQQCYPIVDVELDSIKNDIKVSSKRLEVIKSKKFNDRISKALKLYLNRGYHSTNGFKSCLSDIFGS